jgi:hypothetical protein
MIWRRVIQRIVLENLHTVCVRLVYSIVVDIKLMRMFYPVQKFNNSFPDMAKMCFWLHHVDVLPVAVESELCKWYSKQTMKSSVRETSIDIPVISKWNKSAIRYSLRILKFFSSSVIMFIATFI